MHNLMVCNDPKIFFLLQGNSRPFLRQNFKFLDPFPFITFTRNLFVINYFDLGVLNMEVKRLNKIHFTEQLSTTFPQIYLDIATNRLNWPSGSMQRKSCIWVKLNILMCADNNTNTKKSLEVTLFGFVKYHLSHFACHLSCVTCNLSPTKTDGARSLHSRSNIFFKVC